MELQLNMEILDDFKEQCPKFSPCTPSSASAWQEASMTPPNKPKSTQQTISASKKHAKYDFCIQAKAASIPMPLKNSKGEDAYYISKDSIGVSDGVGGWIAFGIDPGLYSTKLMTNASFHSVCETCPREILHKAYDEMGDVMGTATACIATINNETGMLKCANLGDSGFLLIRPSNDEGGNTSFDVSSIICRSSEQQHYFNCPRQIGTDAVDHPRDADMYEAKVAEGDLIIMATDGFFDNLFEEDVCKILTDHFAERPFDAKHAGSSMDLLADRLARSALNASLDGKKETPFSMSAFSNHIDFRGGKQDDITVVCAIIAKGVSASSHSPMVFTAEEVSLAL